MSALAVVESSRVHCLVGFFYLVYMHRWPAQTIVSPRQS